MCSVQPLSFYRLGALFKFVMAIYFHTVNADFCFMQKKTVILFLLDMQLFFILFHKVYIGTLYRLNRHMQNDSLAKLKETKDNRENQPFENVTNEIKIISCENKMFVKHFNETELNIFLNFNLITFV